MRTSTTSSYAASGRPRRGHLEREVEVVDDALDGEGVHEVARREDVALGRDGPGRAVLARGARTAARLVSVHCSTRKCEPPYAAAAFAAYRAWPSAPGCPGCHADQYETAVVSAGASGAVVKTTSARCASHIWWNSRSLTDQSAVRVRWSKDSSSSPDTTVVVAS